MAFSFSSKGAYKVSAKAGQYTLDECAIIRSGTLIYPYFINPVDEDRDIQKLTVFLQSSYGEILSKKITYVINPDVETSTNEFASPNSSDEANKPGAGSGAVPSSTSDSTSGANPDPDAGSVADPDSSPASKPSFTSDSSSGTNPDFTPDSKSAVEPGFTPDTGSSVAPGFTPDSSSEDTPDSKSAVEPGFTPDTGSSVESGFTPDSKFEAEPGFTPDTGSVVDFGYGDSSVFTPDAFSTIDTPFTADFDFTPEFDSADGIGFIPDSVSDTTYVDAYYWEGTAEEILQKEDIYRFQKWGSIIQPTAAYNEDIIYVKKLSGSLPPLLLPEDIAAGQYLLVFQIIGKNGVLNQTDKPFYYIGASEFAVDDIHAYLPGIFDKTHVVSPEIPVMLETRLAAGSDLNPYVVWYNGRKRIHEGYVADGAARFIWRTPAQTGFHLLKVEAFPFKPLGVQAPIGKSKELSLPVAAKNEGPVTRDVSARSEIVFSGQELIPIRRYQLFADLEDSQGSKGDRNALIPEDHIPEWLPQGNIFGLGVGPAHSFLIPTPLFAPVEDTEGQLLFRFVPLAEGIIFSGSFMLEQTGDFEQSEWFETLDMNLSYADGVVSLRYFAGKASGEKSVFLLPGQTEGVITVVTSFAVQGDTLRLSVGLNTPAKFLADEAIFLPGHLTGAGTFRLGADAFDSLSLSSGAETSPTETAASPVIIFDEIIVLLVPDISRNKRVETVAVVVPSLLEIQEDGGDENLSEDVVPIEAIEEIADESEAVTPPHQKLARGR